MCSKRRFSFFCRCAILTTLVITTTAAAYLGNNDDPGSSPLSAAAAENLIDHPLNVAPSLPKMVAKQERYESYYKRPSFSVTQDLDALAEMLRESQRRRRLQNAIAFFNALRKKRDTGNARQQLFPEQLVEDYRRK